jgi:hypothetical protein
MSQIDKDALPKPLKTIYTVSIFVCSGSFIGLKVINSRELLPWLKPEEIPYFGYPLLIIFLVSLLFGAKGLIETIKSLNKLRTVWLKIAEQAEKEETKEE